MTIDTSTFDPTVGDWEIQAALKREEEMRKAEEQRVQQEAAAKQQADAMAKDSHAALPADKYGTKENFQELGNAITGGVRDTASSLLTAPERAADMANGQMVEQGKNYRPDWDPLGGDKNPITKTWWGGLIRGGVHFASMSAALFGAEALARRVPGGKALTRQFHEMGSLERAAIAGVTTDALSEYSQGDNGLGALVKHFPQLDNPLATHDADHPALKTLKNIVEGMGVGMIFDVVGNAIGGARHNLGKTNKPGTEALQAVDARMETRRAEIEAKAKEAVDLSLRQNTAQYLFERGVDFNKLDPTQQLDEMAKLAKRRKGYETWNPPVKQTTFTTAKGSTYSVLENGTTQRNKAPRPEHPDDSGLKTPSDRTIYVDGDASGLSWAGLSNVKDARIVINPNGTVSMVWQNPKTGQYGASSSGKDIPFYTEPAVGRSPLEVWKRSDLNGLEAYTKVHAGNKITELRVSPGETNLDRAARKAEERTRSIEDQIIDKAEVEILEPGFRGHKNKPIADPWQGSPTSTGSAYDAVKDLKRIHTSMDPDVGSTHSIVTPAAAERMASTSGIATEDLDALAKNLLGDARVEALHKELRAQRLSFYEIYGDALERMDEVINGRNTTDLTPEQFWESFYKNQDSTDGLEYWATREVVAADLINGTLLKEIRDHAMGAREIQGVADVMDIDGPVKMVRDRLIVGLTNVKRSRFLASQGLSNLRLNKPKDAARLVNERLGELHAETVEAVDTMLTIAQQAPTDEMLQAVLEAFSMSNKMRNFDDLDRWMRGRLRGMTTEDGVKHTGALIKELQGVMVHSILSGPKTPARAILGTGIATYLRPVSQAVGASMRGDWATMRTSMASANAAIQTIPEAFSLFKTKLGSYLTGDVSTIKTRFSEYSPSDQQWELMGHLVETRGSVGDKIAYYVTNIARTLNNSSFLNYSTKIMAATDDAFAHIMGRARARELALREAMESTKQGDVTVVSKELIQAYEDRFMKEIFDENGNIADKALQFAKEEATLTTDLSGFAAGLDTLMNAHPWTKPFYLFAKTGVNGLNMTLKHAPLMSAFLKETRDILFGDPERLFEVSKYGISNATDLANAKALILGRQAIGTAVVFTAAQAFMSGNLRGEGPPDRQQRQLWLDAGWTPRSIKLGDAWVSYESLEPFNNLLSTIATIGEASHMMGPQWTEDQLRLTSIALMQATVSKSYLSGLSSLMDLFTNDPKAMARVAANIMNNQVPLAGLRNEIGKVLTPYMRELNSGISDSIRNRNLASEHLTSDPLPIKYDIFTGQPVKDWDFMTRMFNAVSPISMNFEESPGRTLLFNSGYDLRASVLSSPTSVSLAKDAKARSAYQRAIGQQGIGRQLDELAKRQDVQDSVNRMIADRNAGRGLVDPMQGYLHNDLIRKIMDEARYKAWAQVQNNPEIKVLVDKKVQADRLNYNTRQGNTAAATDAYQQILQLQNR